MTRILAITRKELSGYFGSPMALIFVGVFLAATLFTFFWGEAFFSRGIADVRPLFAWMPLLLIFLVAALTMRQWSEEQRTGTLEVLMTLPARSIQLVLGKFLSVMALVALALVLTLPLPITVSILGNMDWGPVFGGYIAAILLASAYVAIGLFISSRTDNQIVALILTVLFGGLLYLVGTSGVTDFAGTTGGEILRAIGAGSRFESIERGVIDIRDLLYYLSLTVLFLLLNVVSLESKRWSESEATQPSRQSLLLTTALVAVNLFALNLWIYPLTQVRFDLTEFNEYSLSPVTKELVSDLQEPLLIRAYLSENTHPLLAPLAPTVRDLLEEYRIASNGQVVIEVIDPLQNPEREAEATQVYGIQATPLQAADRYGTSLVNAYFDILVRYGDQFEVLNFRDLIEVQPSRSGDVDVRLRNLEYDLTSAIKKTVFGFQSIDAVLASLEEPVQLSFYVTPSTLPAELQEVPAMVQTVAEDIAAESNGQFQFTVYDLDDPNNADQQARLDQLGVQPIFANLFSPDSYYLHMIMETGTQEQIIFPPNDASEATVRTAIEGALQRTAPGFLRVVGLWTPFDVPQTNAFGQQSPSLKQYNVIAEVLRQDYTVQDVNLGSGQVPPEVDVMLVIAPQNMGEVERYAIDQYLMRGGSVVVAAGNYALGLDQFGSNLALTPIANGLQEMLASYGVEVQNGLVMDPQNEPFPVPVVRDVGGFQVQEIQAINYPFFVDVRSDGMDLQSPIVGNLPAVTLNWASPVQVTNPITSDESAASLPREVTVLMRSSEQSWLRSSPDIQPDLETYPELGFPIEGQQQSYPLAVSIQGQFESFYKDKPNPLLEDAPAEGEAAEPAESAAPNTVSTIETSPDTARLIVIGSGEFLNDVVFDISGQLTRDRYLNSLQFAQNAVDWAVEDLDLLTIRSRGTSVRILDPVSEGTQSFYEGLNYAVAIVSVIVIGFVWRAWRENEQPMELLEPDDSPVHEPTQSSTKAASA